MKKGISVWLFSKMVMLVFLLLTFSTIIAFSGLLSERTYADAADVLTEQIKDSFTGVLITGSLSAQRVVPLPERLPETGEGKHYALDVSIFEYQNSHYLSIALGWVPRGSTALTTYAAASSLAIPTTGIMEINGDDRLDNFEPIILDSENYRFIVIRKKTEQGITKIYVGGCRQRIQENECYPPNIDDYE